MVQVQESLTPQVITVETTINGKAIQADIPSHRGIRAVLKPNGSKGSGKREKFFTQIVGRKCLKRGFEGGGRGEIHPRG